MKSEKIYDNPPHIPFDKLRRDCNLIIYGMGDMGQRCYTQLKHSKYTKIIGCCDKKKNENNEYPRWISMEKICTCNFDIVLICIMDKNIVKEVQDQLMSFNIESNKIYHLYMGYDIRFGLESISCAEIASMITKQIYVMRNIAKRPEEYIQGIGKYILEDMHLSLSTIKKIVDLLESPFDKIIFLRYIYEHKVFDSECMETYMKSLLSLKNEDDTLYGLAIDTTLMLFENFSYIYNNFFLDRMKLQIKLSDYYGLDVGGNKKKIKKIKKIAIIAQRFCCDNYWDATSKIVFLCAKGLKNNNYNVKIFNLCSMQKDSVNNVFLEYPSGMKKKFLNNCESVRNQIEIYEPSSDNVSERLNQNVNAIDLFCPDIIIDMADEMFIEGYALNKKYIIINQPMRSMSYSSFASLYLIYSKITAQKDMEKYKSISVDKFIEMNLSYTDMEKIKIYHRRENYGFTKDDFLIVTVGTRLKKEIDYKMVQNMITFLDNNSRARWILIGDGAGDAFNQYSNYFKEHRIIEWGMEEHLMSLYTMCDVYINPIRKGGGLSIRQAMIAGLPIISSDYNMSTLNMMKKEHIVHGDYNEMMIYMESLLKDSKKYQKIKRETLHQMENKSVENDVLALINRLENIFK